MVKPVVIQASDREVAKAVVLALAEWEPGKWVAPRAFYDDDAEWLERVLELLGVASTKGMSYRYLTSRLHRVMGKLAEAGVLCREHRVNPDKQYIGEPRSQTEYKFSKHSYGLRLRPDLIQPHHHYTPEYSAEFELKWILRRAYPIPEEA